jgi:hypothetical protein
VRSFREQGELRGVLGIESHVEARCVSGHSFDTSTKQHDSCTDEVNSTFFHCSWPRERIDPDPETMGRGCS